MRTTTAYMPRNNRISTAKIRLTNPFPGLSAAFLRRVGLQGIPRASLNRPAPPGAPPILVSLLFLSTCRNYEVSDERTHRIAIQAELLEDILSQMTCIKHRRFYDVARRQR